MSSLRLTEACEVLGLSRRKVRELVRDGVLPAGRLPGAHSELRFDPDTVHTFRRKLVGLHE